ncbi:MAG TPA: TonB-dependent receptor [Rhodothermales bacterium]|nr:TonB-dependent receptor [Rhodothermales bacterium]
MLPCAGLLLLLSGAAHAQAPADSARYTLPLVYVTAVRGQSEAALATARVVRFTRDDFDATRATTLADALERRGGAFIRRYGPGGLASISLRGSGAGQTALLLDGLRVNDPQLGQVDLSLVPAALLDRAEVLHGATAAWHGTDAIGGAVLLTSRRASGLDIRGETGTFGTGRLDLSTGRKSGNLDVGLMVGAETSTGRFGYLDRTQFPPVETTRQGADRRAVSVLGTVGVHGRRSETRSGLWMASGARGLPGPAGMAPAGERQDDALARLWGTHRRALGGAVVRVAGWVHGGRLRYLHPGLGLDETSRTRVVGGEAEVTGSPAAGWTTGGGLAASQATARHPSLREVRPERALAAFGHVARVRGRLTLTGALRLDHYAQAIRAYTPVSPRLGARFALGHGWAVKAGAGRSFRAPTFNDRFWQGAGRPDLRPERGWSAESGLAWNHVTFDAELTVYVHALRDEIVWQPEGSVWRPANVRRTRTEGLEASLLGEHGRLSGGVFATLTYARDRSTPGSPTYGQQLRFVPRATARADAAVTMFGPARSTWYLNGALQAVGARPVTADGTQALPAYALVSLGVAVARAPFALDVRLENAFDAEYRVVEGYPMPGRHAYVGLRFTL